MAVQLSIPDNKMLKPGNVISEFITWQRGCNGAVAKWTYSWRLRRQHIGQN